MNYLSHYRYEPPGLYDTEVAGLVLPDLSRLRGKGFRLKALRNRGLLTDEEALNQGIKRHITADAVWHSSTSLKTLQAVIAQRVSVGGMTIPRSFFFAHIASELFLDRYLLEVEPELVIDFYNALNRVEPDAVRRLIAKGEHPELAAAVEAEFERFREVRFLERYGEDAHLVAILKGIYRGVVKVNLELDAWQIGDLYTAIYPTLQVVARQFFTPWPV